MYVDSGANRVGIGNASPTSALLVTGDIKATTDLTAGNNLYVEGGNIINTSGNIALQSSGTGSPAITMSNDCEVLGVLTMSGDAHVALGTAASPTTVNAVISVNGTTVQELTPTGVIMTKKLATSYHEMAFKEVTADYTIDDGDYVIMCNSASDLTVSLDLSTSYNFETGYMQEYYVSNANTGKVTISCTGTETFVDGLEHVHMKYKGDDVHLGLGASGWARISDIDVVTKASTSTNQSIATETAIDFETTDIQNCEDAIEHASATSDRITVHRDGLYDIDGSISIDSTGGAMRWQAYAFIAVDGNELEDTKVRTGNYQSEDGFLHVATTVELDAGNYVELKSDATNLTGNVVSGWFRVKGRI